MKKTLVFIVLGILFLCPATAKTPSKSQLLGWWKLTVTNHSSSEDSYRKLYFSEDNYFFSATYSEGTVSMYNSGQYYVFSDGKLATIHQNSNGELSRVACTYPIELRGDSLHLYGFYLSQVAGSPVEKYESILIDEWWVRSSSFITPSTTATTSNEASINWVKSKSATSPVRKPYSPQTFFRRDSAFCRGYISGFNKLHNKTTFGAVRFVENELTGETKPVAVEIQPNGRFEFALPLVHPKQIKLEIDGSPILIYMEPGQVLGMVLDWKDLFLFRGKNQSRLIQFYGPLATINQQVQTISKLSADFAYIRNVANELTPREFFDMRAREMSAYETLLSAEQKENNYSAEAIEIARFDAYCKYSAELLFFGQLYQNLTRDTTQKKEPLNESEYFSFLKKVPLNDPRMLISNYYATFIDDFDESSVYLNNKPLQLDPQPAKTYRKFLIEDCNITLNPEEKEYFDLIEGINRPPLTQAKMQALSQAQKNINTKYRSYYTTYTDIFVRPLKHTPYDEMTEIRWKRNDSTLFNKLGISPNLTTEIVRLRQLQVYLQSMNQNDGTNLVNRLDTYVTHPFLKTEAKRLLEARYGKKPATELPKGKEAEAFKRIIDPFKGKLVVVDFWATTCGPCVSYIKQMHDARKSYANDPEVAFVFITDVSSSPQADYEKFVKEQELVNTYRVSDGEFILFRNLFSFDGIPHYEFVDKMARSSKAMKA